MKSCIAWLLIVSALAMSACATPAAADHSDLSVEMLYAPGWGLPGYRLTVSGDGSMSYETTCGISAGCATEKRNSRLPPQEIDALAAAINRAGLWGLKDGNLSQIMCADCAMVDLNVALGGRRREVYFPELACKGLSQAGVPRRVCDLYELMSRYVPATPVGAPLPAVTQVPTSMTMPAASSDRRRAGACPDGGRGVV